MAKIVRWEVSEVSVMFGKHQHSAESLRVLQIWNLNLILSEAPYNSLISYLLF